MSKLLIDESPLQVLPTLAVRLGLNEAIFLQQLHWLTRELKPDANGNKWLRRTYPQWQKLTFPFWSIRTIERAANSLCKVNLILIDQRDKSKRNRDNFYTINRPIFDKWEAEAARSSGGFDAANLADSEHDKMADSDAANLADSYKDQRVENKEREEEAESATTPPPVFDSKRSSRIASQATQHVKPKNDTPAIVRAVAKVANNWKPDKDLWPALADQFPDDVPIDEVVLKQCFTEWRLKGWRKENLAWLTKWYAQGHPDEYQSNGNSKPAKAPILDCNGAVITADYGSYFFVESCNGDGGTSPRWRTAAGMARQQRITLEEAYERRPPEHWPPNEKYPYHEDTIGGGDRPVTVW